jgi:hypothetical protein
MSVVQSQFNLKIREVKKRTKLEVKEETKDLRKDAINKGEVNKELKKGRKKKHTKNQQKGGKTEKRKKGVIKAESDKDIPVNSVYLGFSEVGVGACFQFCRSSTGCVTQWFPSDPLPATRGSLCAFARH